MHLKINFIFFVFLFSKGYCAQLQTNQNVNQEKLVKLVKILRENIRLSEHNAYNGIIESETTIYTRIEDFFRNNEVNLNEKVLDYTILWHLVDARKYSTKFSSKFFEKICILFLKQNANPFIVEEHGAPFFTAYYSFFDFKGILNYEWIGKAFSHVDELIRPKFESFHLLRETTKLPNELIALIFFFELFNG